jgi:hypothetical protein
LGVHLPKNWKLAFGYHDAVIPLLDKWDSQGIAFAIKNTPAGMAIETGGGVSAKLLSDNLVIEFKYSVEVDPLRGSTPPLAVRPYGEILQEVAEMAIELLDVFAHSAGVRTDRIGIIATSQMDPQKMPPGVARMLDAYERMWTGELLKIDATAVVVVLSEKLTVDQCHHRLQLDHSQPTPEVQVTLDWQRRFLEPRDLRGAEISGTIQACVKSALGHFQRIGEGTL